MKASISVWGGVGRGVKSTWKKQKKQKQIKSKDNFTFTKINL